MTTFREIVNMVLDRNKLSGDDSYIEPEHILFLSSKLRAYLITSKYKQAKAQVAQTNFQTLTLELEPADSGCGCDTNGMYMAKSTTKVPNLLLINNYEGMASISPLNTFGCLSRFDIVNTARFATVGVGKWQRLQSYAAISNDGYLYLKSADSGIQDMESIQLTAVFEDAEKAAKMEAESQYNDCNPDETSCDVMDMQFPLEEGLVTLLIENISNAIAGTNAVPQDTKNSANDELGNLMNYINTLLKDRYKRNTQATDNE